ncbi:MAG: hypothetical protein HYR96_02615 [Deltaproteobacteria bacterium]|nr:hypothetical protein [Deltaproteobacteria bacterium]MBI3296263.1 hypothetical protein [Deltaproteobacteria bacterium]
MPFTILRNSLSLAIPVLRRNWLLILFLQIPLAVSEFTQEFLGVNDAVQPSAVAIAIVLPVFFIMSFFSSALTFAAVQIAESKGSVLLAEIWESVSPKLGALLLASLVVGVISGIGLVALILPGLVLMTYFLFVPHTIIADPPVSLWAVVTRSKRLAFGHFVLSFLLVLLSFGLSTLLFLLGEQFGTYLGAWGSDEFSRRLLLLTLRCLFSIAGGGLVDVIISTYFLTLRRFSEAR